MKPNDWYLIWEYPIYFNLGLSFGDGLPDVFFAPTLRCDRMMEHITLDTSFYVIADYPTTISIGRIEEGTTLEGRLAYFLANLGNK